MGMFGDMFKDLSEMGTPAGKLRGKFDNLSKLLTEYSFGTGNFSPALGKQKIIVVFNEALEVADKCSKTDKVRMYFPSKTVEPTILVAIKAAEYWIDFVLEQERKFTNSLAIQLIERAEYDLLNQPSTVAKTSSSQIVLSDQLPNFIKYMNEMSSVVTNHYRITDSSNKIEYKSPIITYGRTMGYNHYIIQKKSNSSYEMYQVVNGNGGQQLISSKKIFYDDQDYEEYEEQFNDIAMELMGNPVYIQIATADF